MNTHPLLRAPHRAAFLPGLVLGAVLLAAWLVELASRLGTPIPLAVPPSQAHGLLMLYGIFPFFMAGFIFTAGPRWLGVPPPAPSRYLAVPALMASGVALMLAGTLAGRAWLLAGLAAYTLGFAALTATFARLIAQSQAADRRHAQVVEAGFVAGLLGLGAALWWLLSGDARGWLIMRDLALWGFLLPVFLAVCHRMLPFFSSSVLAPYQAWRPYWLLAAFVAGSWGHGLLSLAAQPSWPLDLALAVLFAYTSWRWRLLQSLRVRLLAMLHLAFAWLAVGFALYALQGMLAAAGVYALGFAPLHAVTTGFFFTMLIGFASRVMLGHSGRPLQANRPLWALYLAAHAMALLRVVADVVPLHTPLLLAAGAGWLLVFLLWNRDFAPITVKPRADGQPG